MFHQWADNHVTLLPEWLLDFRGKCGKEIPPEEKGMKKASPRLCLCQPLHGLFLTQPGVPEWQSQELKTHREKLVEHNDAVSF